MTWRWARREALGLTAEQCRPGLASFRGLPHRVEKVAHRGRPVPLAPEKVRRPVERLVGLGIDSISLTPDRVLRTMQAVAWSFSSWEPWVSQLP